MGFSVFVNIVGSILSIVAIVLYALHLARFTVIGMCGTLDDRNSKNCLFLASLAKVLNIFLPLNTLTCQEHGAEDVSV